MDEHPIIAFLTGGGMLMGLSAYTIKNLLGKIDYLKKKVHKHDIDIAVLVEKVKK